MLFNQPEDEFLDGDEVVGMGTLGKEGSGRLRMQVSTHLRECLLRPRVVEIFSGSCSYRRRTKWQVPEQAVLGVVSAWFVISSV